MEKERLWVGDALCRCNIWLHIYRASLPAVDFSTVSEHWSVSSPSFCSVFKMMAFSFSLCNVVSLVLRSFLLKWEWPPAMKGIKDIKKDIVSFITEHHQTTISTKTATILSKKCWFTVRLGTSDHHWFLFLFQYYSIVNTHFSSKLHSLLFVMHLPFSSKNRFSSTGCIKPHDNEQFIRYSRRTPEGEVLIKFD